MFFFSAWQRRAKNITGSSKKRDISETKPEQESSCTDSNEPETLERVTKRVRIVEPVLEASNGISASDSAAMNPSVTLPSSCGGGSDEDWTMVRTSSPTPPAAAADDSALLALSPSLEPSQPHEPNKQEERAPSWTASPASTSSSSTTTTTSTITATTTAFRNKNDSSTKGSFTLRALPSYFPDPFSVPYTVSTQSPAPSANEKNPSTGSVATTAASSSSLPACQYTSDALPEDAGDTPETSSSRQGSQSNGNVDDTGGAVVVSITTTDEVLENDTSDVARGNKDDRHNDDVSSKKQSFIFGGRPNGLGVRHCAGCLPRQDQEPPTATVYCYECARCFCDKCDDRLHDNTDALDSLHRPLCSHHVEYIQNGGGLRILTPLLDLSVLVAVLQSARYFWTRQTIQYLVSVNYFLESTCPLVQQIRLAIFSLDHTTLYPFLRTPLNGWCDSEDALWKLFSDVWVRGTWTQTDSFALIWVKSYSMLGALMAHLVILPLLLAIPYALVATVIRGIEITLVPNGLVTTRCLAQLIHLASWTAWMPVRFVGWCCHATALGLILDQDSAGHDSDNYGFAQLPPKTGALKRPQPSLVGWDWPFRGFLRRKTRTFAYFYTKARRLVVGSMITMVASALTLRVLLLSLPRCEHSEDGTVHNTGSQDELFDLPQVPVRIHGKTPTFCVSMDLVAARQLSQQIFGFDILPALANDVGLEGQVLAKMMRQATEHDYLDEMLRRLGSRLALRFGTWPWQIQGGIVAVLVVVAFCGGLLRNALVRMDARRRYRCRNVAQEN